MAAAVPAGPDPAEVAGAAPEPALEPRPELGLGPEAGFRPLEARTDELGARHLRLQQYYRGLRVWGGQAILHRGPDGGEQPMTDALVRGVRVEPTPNLTPAEALAVADRKESPQGTYARPPRAELLVYPAQSLAPVAGAADPADASAWRPLVVAQHLAYHVHFELENGAPETRHDDYLVDAHTGALLKAWSTLLTVQSPAPGRARPKPKTGGKGEAVTTTGHSQYSGDVQLGSLKMDCGFILSDPTRSNLATRDLAGASSGKGILYVSQDGTWGDGQNYDPTRGTRSANGQTAAVDAHYGLQTTWDFYRNVLGRDGIDGKGRTATNYVHYAQDFDNAFWADECFCMTYGDGNSTFKTLTSLDVVGHEVAHGLCSATANLEYDGEPGGLNEANSDIFGVMVHLYGRQAGGQGTALPDRGARWTIGEDLETPENTQPIRYLYKPSLDGFSPDAWSRDLDQQDVHFSSGPMNRAFYFLSQGASADPKSDTYSKYIPKGMKGIGNDKALRVWWRTLSTYLTPRSRYQDARKGALRSARDLYGARSAEAKAVDQAFRAINVNGGNALVAGM